MREPIEDRIYGIDLTNAGLVYRDGFPAYVRTQGRRIGSIQATTSGAWSTGVITVYKSNDGVSKGAEVCTLGPGEAHESLAAIDTRGFLFEVSTAENGTLVNLHIYLNDDE